jgi:hypothetical protein
VVAARKPAISNADNVIETFIWNSCLRGFRVEGAIRTLTMRPETGLIQINGALLASESGYS